MSMVTHPRLIKQQRLAFGPGRFSGTGIHYTLRYGDADRAHSVEYLRHTNKYTIPAICLCLTDAATRFCMFYREAYNKFKLGYFHFCYTLSEARSGVNWADLMAAQGTFGTEFYNRSTRTIVGTML